MNGFIAFMEKYFIPYAAKIGGQRHLVAVMVSLQLCHL